MPSRRAGLLLLPLLLLIGAAFLVPLGLSLTTAFRDPEFAAALPRTAALLRAWDDASLPNDELFPTLSAELHQAEQNQAIGALIRRLNFETPGLRPLLLRTARAGLLSKPEMLALDPRWGDPALWSLLRSATGPWTGLYILRAVDLTRSPNGQIAPAPPDQALFRAVFARTFGIAAIVTAITLLLAYPVAAALTQARGAWGRAGLVLVLMPFWISILVRTTAWFILLQREGPVNAALLALGLVDHPVQMMFTRFAVLLSLIHTLLPFAVLPLMAAMRRIDPALTRAGSGLGAQPWQVFLRIYLPLSMPGILAGGGIVFLVAVGFYTAPALMGGPADQMAGSFIATYVNETLNWGMAAALSLVLLLGTAAILAIAYLVLAWRPHRRANP